jgi:hypothetical protein
VLKKFIIILYRKQIAFRDAISISVAALLKLISFSPEKLLSLSIFLFAFTNAFSQKIELNILFNDTAIKVFEGYYLQQVHQLECGKI